MKKVVLSLMALLLAGGLTAQNEWPWQVGIAKTHKDPKTDRIKFISYQPGAELDAAAFTSFLNEGLAPSTDDEFRYQRMFEDRLGYAHLVFEQYHKGYKVDGAVWKAHTLNGRVRSMNGETYKIEHHPTNTLSRNAAFSKALQAMNANAYMWEIPGQELFLKHLKGDPQATYLPAGELVYMQNQLGTASESWRLAWKFNIYAAEPLAREEVYIDAENGEVIFRHNLIHTADRPGQAQTRYSGLQDIVADSANGQYTLREANGGIPIETFNLLNGTNYNNAIDLFDDDNFWDIMDTAYVTGALDAHWGAEKTFEYFNTLFGRSSFDDQGSPLISFVNYGNSYFNAFWNGSVMTYGAGPGNNSPLTGMDVCGHEFTHGVTGNSSGLIYQNESGALNESFSDIFGTTIEFFAKGADGNWLIGEDIGAFRSMSSPGDFFDPDTYLGSNWATGTADNGGVHTNSGVQNYWFYLLTVGGSGSNDNMDNFNVTGIGMNDAAAVAYRNNNVYLTPNSGYEDARFFAIQSAIDLFGTCDSRVFEVMNAWQAVGVGSAYTGVLVADYEPQDTLFCALPAVVDFKNTSESAFSYQWDFGDGNTSTDVNPTHVYQNLGSYDVTLIAFDCNGNADTLIEAARIVIDFNQICPINMPGDGSEVLAQACNGFLFDAGGNDDYPNNALSTLTLESPSNDNISLVFTSFEYAPGDYIRIYDGPDIFSPLLGTYTGTNSPGTVISSGNSLTIREFTNGVNQRPGFEASWSCVEVSTESPIQDRLQVWPNPATDQVRILKNLSSSASAEIRLTDVYGKVLLTRQFDDLSVLDTQIALADLATGFYFVQVSIDGTRETVKIQKQ